MSTDQETFKIHFSPAESSLPTVRPQRVLDIPNSGKEKAVRVIFVLELF